MRYLKRNQPRHPKASGIRTNRRRTRAVCAGFGTFGVRRLFAAFGFFGRETLSGPCAPSKDPKAANSRRTPNVPKPAQPPATRTCKSVVFHLWLNPHEFSYNMA